MEQAGLHQGLELRLEVLRHRMRTLAEKMSRAEGVQKIENLGDLDRLERRYDELRRRLNELNREGPGFRHGVTYELEKFFSDVVGSFGDFIMWTDFRYLTGKRPPHSS